MVLRWQDRTGERRWLLVECKLSESLGAAHAARQALFDLLAYRRAFEPVLGSARVPYGLGLVWGEGLAASQASEVLLATTDGIPAAIKAVVQ